MLFLERLFCMNIKILGQTDEYGYFDAASINLQESGDLIIVQAVGFVEGSRTIYPSLDHSPFLHIELLPLNNPQSFSSESGGQISFGEESSSLTSLTFPESSIIMESSGLPYNGSVNVFAHVIDPTTIFGLDQMPGDLTAIDAEGETVGLGSFGMISAELQTPSGEKLNIKEGADVLVSFPIPEDLVFDAPQEIPLWYFDLDRKKWIEDGKAIKTGNHYEGKVSHFSFWNCDLPLENVQFSITLKNPTGIPYVATTVKLKSSSGASAAGRTNVDGFVTGRIPKNEVLQMDIINDCGRIVYSESIGPYSLDYDYGILELNIVGGAEYEITGKVIDCDSDPIAGAQVLIWHENSSKRITTKSDGTFNYLAFVCDPTELSFEIQAIDLVNNIASNKTTEAFTGPLTDIGDISACITTDYEYYSIKVDTFEYTFLDSVSTTLDIGGSKFAIKGFYDDGMVVDGPFTITEISNLDFNAPGVYTQFADINHIYSTGFGATYEQVNGNYELDFTIHQVPSGPGYLKGSYTGIVNMTRIQTVVTAVEFSGEFSIWKE